TSASEPMVINLGNSYLTGSVESHRRPLMVDSMTALSNAYQLPPLSAALPMHQFETIALSLLEPQDSRAGHIAVQALPSNIHSLEHISAPKVTVQYDQSAPLVRENMEIGVANAAVLAEPGTVIHPT